MRNRASSIIFTDAPLRAMAAAAGAAVAAAPPQTSVSVWPPMSPKDEAVFLLHTAAEIEHMLMVQYLYAAWSLPRDSTGRVLRWRTAIIEIAKEEMAHFVAVQNVLRFLGGPLNFDREDFPFRSDFYPFPFELGPLDQKRVARYVVAEMPAETHIDAGLLAEIKSRATDDGLAINRVGALYDRILKLIGDEDMLSDSVFRPDPPADLQAAPAGFRADVGRGPLFVRTLNSRADAVSLLTDVARQGEGEADAPESHFLTFVEIYDQFTSQPTPALLVPVHPRVSPPGCPGGSGVITHPRSAAWAVAFNHHYRMLLAWLEHALGEPRTTADATALRLRVFDEMFILSDIGQLLPLLPCGEDDDAPRAGAPFELPYTLAIPDQPTDQWLFHADLLATARQQLTDLTDHATDVEQAILPRLEASVAAGEEFVKQHLVEP